MARKNKGVVAVIGEVLFDIFPDGRRLGGAPFNVAYHLSRMGIPVRFITRIGDDPDGEQILEFMRKHSFCVDFVQIDPEKPTGRVIIEPEEGGGHIFRILPDVAYDYLEPNDEIRSLIREDTRCLYFGSLIQRTAPGFSFIGELAGGSEGAVRFYDVNLRPGGYDRNIIERSLKFCSILKLNEEEFGELNRMLTGGMYDIDFERYLFDSYNIEIIFITMGSQGSRMVTPDGVYRRAAESAPNIEDTVGAGDAYSAAVIHGLISGYPLQETVDRASSFASGMCTVKGAIPENRDFYGQWTKK